MKIVILLLLLLLFSCGNDPQYENYNMSGIADITLSEDNHPHGFGRSECFNCHIKVNIHAVDTIGAGESTLEIARSLTATQGESSCSGCHGANGL